MARMPYVDVIQGLNKKKFDNVEFKSMTECVICMVDFEPDDEIAELKCDNRHYFHTKCLEDWLK